MNLIGHWSIQEYGKLMEHRVRIIMGPFQDEAKIWWDSIMGSTFSGRQPQVKKRKRGISKHLGRDL